MRTILDAYLPVIEWARDLFGINVIHETRPGQYTWLGDGRLYIPDLLYRSVCHEIGHYVVCPSDRRVMPDYALHIYTTDEFDIIKSSNQTNNHLLEEGRARAYGCLLDQHFEIGGSDKYLSPFDNKSPYHTLDAVEWLKENNLITLSGAITGKTFNGQFPLDNPLNILRAKE